MDLTIISLNSVCADLRFIFGADENYFKRLFKLGRIELPPVNLSKLLSKKVIKFSNLFDQSTLCVCAHAIFFACGDEHDEELRDMHSSFIASVKKIGVERYEERVRKVCAKYYNMKDILDYMADEFSDLQTEIDEDESKST